MTLFLDNCTKNSVTMSCVPCGDPCSSVSKDDVDRWTNSLKNVLANQIALKMFEDYLHLCKLDSADILELWKMCDRLLRYVHHKKIEKYAPINSCLLVIGLNSICARRRNVVPIGVLCLHYVLTFAANRRRSKTTMMP